MKNNFQSNGKGRYQRVWKLLISMLFILTMGIGQMWGAERQIPTTVLTLPTTGLSSTWSSSFTASHYYYHDNTNHYVIYYPYAVRMSKSTQTWVADDGGGSTEISDGYSSTGIFKGFTYFNALDGSSKKRCDKLSKSTGTIVTYRVTNCTAVSAYIKLGKKNDVVHLKCYVMTEDTPAESAAKSDSYTDASSASTGILNLTGLDAKKEYLVEIYNAGGGSNAQFYEIAFYYPVYTVTYDLNGGTGTTPTEDDQPLGAKFDLHDGVTGITPPTGQEFLKWKDQDADEYDGGDEYTMPAKNVTLTAQWGTATPKYDITFNNGGHGTAPSATNASKVTLAELSASGWVHTGWVADQTVTVDEAEVTAGTKIANGKTAHVSANTAFTAQWSQLYTITEGTPSNGSVDADVEEAVAGATVTITATPATDYLLDAWDVYKTGESGTKVSVTETAGVYTFAMPAYAVTVSATFAADTRPKVLYVTKNNEATTKSSDKLYEALKDDYNVKIVGAAAEVTYTDYALVVLHESVDGSNHNAAAVSPAKTTSVPVLNTKSYFYTSGSSARWGWGTPDAGKSVNGATQNSTYSNIASHPIFAGVTVTAGFVQITDDAANKCMQPVKTITTGYEGYTLATTPNSDSGNGTAIHEIPAGTAARGVSSGRYLMISVSGDKLGALNANGQKLFQNAADYLINGTAWTPVIAPKLLSSVPANSATNIAVEGNIVLTFSENVTLNDASKFTLSGGAGSLTTASISVSGAVVTIPYSGLDNSTEYTLATAAGAVKNGSDVPNAALSNIVFTTEAACTKPGTPDNLAASNLAYTTADLSWDAAANADGYKISIIKKEGEDVILDWTNATTSYAATGLTQGTTYTFKVKAVGATGYCEYGLEAEADFTTTAPSVADLVTIADDYTFTPSVAIPAGTLSADSKFFAAGTGDCDINDGKMRVKENRALAFNVADNAKIKVTFATKSGRQIQLGTALSDGNYDTYGSSESSPYTFDVVTTGGVVYLTAHNDQLYFSKLEIIYPYSITFANGGHGTAPSATTGFEVALAQITGVDGWIHTGWTANKAVKVGTTDIAVGDNIAVDATAAVSDDTQFTAVWVEDIPAVDPEITFNNGNYTIGGEALNLNTLFTSNNTTGAVTYTVKTAGETGAAIDGTNFTATAAGSAVVTATQAASVGFNEKAVDATITISAPAEVDGIKMVVGGDLTGNFISARTLSNGDNVVEGIAYTKYLTMSSTMSSFGNEVAPSATKGIYYYPSHKNIRFYFYVYNNQTSTKKIYIYTVDENAEGTSDATSANVSVEAGRHMVYADVELTKHAAVVFGVENTGMQICQIVAVETGDALLQGGEAGYSIDYNKCYISPKANTVAVYDGIEYKLNADAKLVSASNVQLQTLGTHYIKFHLDAQMQVSVYADNNKYYVGSECSTGDNAKLYEATGNGEFTLGEGNWYINGSGATVKINKLSFALPKAEAPTITTQPATCHTFAPGSMTATVVAEVSDGGTLSYQWHNASDDSEVDGATTATLTTTTEGTYYVIVTNSLAGHQDNSTKSNEAELGYRVTNDATLMALSYGTPATAITLEDGVYTYAVELAKGTTDVPALSATATMDGYATVTISNAAEFVSYAASSTVTVKSEDATVTNVYTVNFSVKHDLPQVDVTASTTWNWANAATTMQKIVPAEKNVEQLMANIDDEGKKLKNDAEFNSQALIFSGQEALVGNSTRWYAKGGHIKFNVTVPGIVKVEFSDNGTNNRRLKINNYVSTESSASETDVKTYAAYVQPGEVTLMGVKNDGTGEDQYIRISKIEFDATADYTRENLNPNNIGTLCWTNNAILGGATLYELAGKNEYNKLVFDEVENNRLVAGMPYIFVPENGNTEIKVYNIDDAAALTSPEDPQTGMMGTFVDLSSADGVTLWDNYVISKNHYILVDSHNVTLKAYRAYITSLDDIDPAPAQQQNSNGAPRRRIIMGAQGEQVTTDINNVQSDDVQCTKVMIDGQLYILRGEKLFDATGRLVK